MKNKKLLLILVVLIILFACKCLFVISRQNSDAKDLSREESLLAKKVHMLIAEKIQKGQIETNSYKLTSHNNGNFWLLEIKNFSTEVSSKYSGQLLYFDKLLFVRIFPYGNEEWTCLYSPYDERSGQYFLSDFTSKVAQPLGARHSGELEIARKIFTGIIAAAYFKLSENQL